jgi:hypothetical protein
MHISFFSPLLLWWMGVHCGTYIGYYNISNISCMTSPPHHFPSSHPPLTPGVLSTGIIFAFTYMCIHFIVLYSPFYFLSPTPPLPIFLSERNQFEKVHTLWYQLYNKNHNSHMSPLFIKSQTSETIKGISCF